jgi:hypothetical protein
METREAATRDGASVEHWNHDPAAIKVALRGSGGVAEWKPEWPVLALPTGEGPRVRKVFSLAAHDERTECRPCSELTRANLSAVTDGHQQPRCALVGHRPCTCRADTHAGHALNAVAWFMRRRWLPPVFCWPASATTLRPVRSQSAGHSQAVVYG